MEQSVNNDVKLWHFYKDNLTCRRQKVRQQTTDEFHTTNIVSIYHACQTHVIIIIIIIIIIISSSTIRIIIIISSSIIIPILQQSKITIC